MITYIKKLFRRLFDRKKVEPRPMPIFVRPKPEPILSEEDWSGNDYLFNKPNSTKCTIIRTKGKVHNVKKIFARLNKEHFDGQIKAKITWGRYGCRNVQRRTSITFGTYSDEELLIRIHPALDSKEVPEYFVEHVIHHEMLHEILPPIQGSRSNWIVHHYDFRLAEAATPSYKSAIAWEHQNTKKIFYAPPKGKGLKKKTEVFADSP